MNKIFNNINKILIVLSIVIVAYLALDLFVLNGQPLINKTTNEGGQEAGEILAENVEKIDADIFYWGSTCPYCHEVQEWMEENAVEEKIGTVSKEVYNNEANSRELTTRAASCGMDTQRIGVPFLYTVDGQCLVGSPDIIGYLSEKIAQ